MSKRLTTRVLFISVTVLALSGCKTNSVPTPVLTLASAYRAGPTTPISENINALSWWKAFDDSALDQLVDRGLSNNLSIKQARQRVDIARVRAAVSGSEWSPNVTASADASVSGDGSTTSQTVSKAAAGSVGASLLLDLFGKKSKTRQRMEARHQAAWADLEIIQLAYLTDIITTYIDFQYFRSAISTTRQNLQSYSTTLSLTRTMRDAGTASNLDVAQAQAQVDSARAELPPLELQLLRSENHLATLIGEFDLDFQNKLKKVRRQPMLGKAQGAGIPVDLLRHRPDIRREERLLVASAADIGIAEAELYPSLSLSGNIEISRLITSGLGTNGLVWAFGPTIVMPVLNGRQLQANVDIAKAQTKIQYLRWRESVLQSVEEVENALIAVQKNKAATYANSRKVTSYQQALTLARESYQGGTSALLDVLEADRFLGQARLDLAQSRRNTAIAFVNLHVAIGGGASALASMELAREPE